MISPIPISAVRISVLCPVLGFLEASYTHASFGSRSVHGTVGTRQSIVPPQQSRDWIDDYVDDEDYEDAGPPVKPDMKYIPRNVMRQHQNFVAIRQAGGQELTNDVYIHEPQSDVFWFVGKVARVSDVSVASAEMIAIF